MLAADLLVIPFISYENLPAIARPCMLCRQMDESASHCGFIAGVASTRSFGTKSIMSQLLPA